MNMDSDNCPDHHPILVGRIYHRISKPLHCNQSRKRPRPKNEHENNAHDIDGSNAIGDGSDNNCVNVGNHRLARGFLFVCQKKLDRANRIFHGVEVEGTNHPINDGVTETAEYVLVVPMSLLKLACKAVATQQIVCITKYSLIRYRGCWGELVSNGLFEGDQNGEESSMRAMRNAYSPAVPDNVKLDQLDGDELITIEIHRNGLHFEPTSSNNTASRKNTDTQKNATILTLEMLSQKENQTTSSKDGRPQKRKISIGKDPMNITGVVDAISPILVNNANDEPFALIELYQPHLDRKNATADADDEPTPVSTAVAIVRGEKALCMHPAIQPGHSITLLGVISRKWKVPDGFSECLKNETHRNRSNGLYHRLQGRVPDRVILVVNSSSIQWNDDGEQDTMLPSTVESLTCIQGIVEAINFHRPSAKDEQKGDRHFVHYVRMKLINPKQQPSEFDGSSQSDELPTNNFVQIHLPRHVLCPNLILGMQPGAILRAVNIHKQDNSCYIACLRSTITVECCASESHPSPLPDHPRFVPRSNPFSLIPEHRITQYSKSFSISATQFFCEEQFKANLNSKWRLISGASNDSPCDIASSTFGSAVCALLKNRNGSADEDESGVAPAKCCTTNENIRDPYAEFFDHAHHPSVSGNKYSKCQDFQHCHDSCNDIFFNIPLVSGVSAICHTSVQDFMSRMKSLAGQSASETGSMNCNNISTRTSSFHSYQYYGPELFEILRGQCKNVAFSEHEFCKKPPSIWTWGNLEWDAVGTDPTVPAFIRVNNIRIPVFFQSCRNDSHDDNESSRKDQTTSNGWLRIESVIVSCICLGPKSSQKNDIDTSGQLVSALDQAPLLLLADKVGAHSGNKFVFTIGDSVFVTSVYFTARSIIPVCARNKAAKTIDTLLPSLGRNINSLFSISNCISIRECLEQVSSSESKHDSFILGRLVRQRFKLRRVKAAVNSSSEKSNRMDKYYDGWNITLCHIDLPLDRVTTDASTLQTIEVQMSIPIVDGPERDLLNSCGELRPDQVTLGLAWLAASSTRNALPILSGGLDECNNQLFAENINSSFCVLPTVIVKIPLSSRSFSKLGYQRFKCRIHEAESFFFYDASISDEHTSLSNRLPPFSTHVIFSARIGKFLPGMLTRRIPRALPAICNGKYLKDDSIVPLIRNKHAPLLQMRTGGGVPSATLADLHWDICEDLKQGNHELMHPSLLRRINNVKILGISFCRAKAECTQCFQFLSHGFTNTEAGDSSQRNLFCPSGCSAASAAIKWECSAIVDDESGQAKLYAEREAALLLLGGGIDVSAVERGAWESAEGILFQPTLPTSSALIQNIREASLQLKRSSATIKTQKENGNAKSVHDLLPADTKAEYLLHYHCRHWYQRHCRRRMDLFCRCKPLSADTKSVNQTEIPVAQAWVSKVGIDFGSALTSTLPPLRLVLEDACESGGDTYDEACLGWDLLTACSRF